MKRINKVSSLMHRIMGDEFGLIKFIVSINRFGACPYENNYKCYVDFICDIYALSWLKRQYNRITGTDIETVVKPCINAKFNIPIKEDIDIEKHCNFSNKSWDIFQAGTFKSRFNLDTNSGQNQLKEELASVIKEGLFEIRHNAMQLQYPRRDCISNKNIVRYLYKKCSNLFYHSYHDIPTAPEKMPLYKLNNIDYSVRDDLKKCYKQLTKWMYEDSNGTSKELYALLYENPNATLKQLAELLNSSDVKINKLKYALKRKMQAYLPVYDILQGYRHQDGIVSLSKICDCGHIVINVYIDDILIDSIIIDFTATRKNKNNK